VSTGGSDRLAEDEQASGPAGLRSPDNTTAIAMVNLRELARQAEEAAVMLEAAGYRMIPRELQSISARLVEVRRALQLLLGDAR